VMHDDGARYVLRTIPYKTVDNVIGGVVITLVDVTRLTAAEARIGELTRDLRNRVDSLQTLLDLVPVAIFILNEDEGGKVRVNRYGAHLLKDDDEQKGPRPVPQSFRLLQG